MKLSDVIKIWDELHRQVLGDFGDVCYSDLEHAIENVCGIENDISPNQPLPQPPEVSLVSDRELTQEEKDYGETVYKNAVRDGIIPENLKAEWDEYDKNVKPFPKEKKK
jgi:hypothetical protein